MEAEINQILSGVPDTNVRKVGHLWQIRVGKRAGARKDGISLAHDLLKARKAKAEPVPVQAAPEVIEKVVEVEKIVEVPVEVEVIKEVPVEVEKVVYRDRPKTNLEKAIEAKDEQPPEELAGFFDGKPHGMAAQELLKEINDLANLIHLELATDADREKHSILSRHAPYLRSKAIEVI